MELLLYSTETKGAGKRMQDIIAGIVSEKHIGIHRTMESLSHRLRQFRGDLSLAVIVTGSREELDDVLSLRNLFQDIPLVLILPDKEPDTVSKGYKLYPRYISDAEDNFILVAAVLEKMIKRLSSSSKQVTDCQLPDRAVEVERY